MIWILEQEVAASGFTEISGENFNSVDIDCDSGCGRAVAGDLLLLFLVILVRWKRVIDKDLLLYIIDISSSYK